MSDKDNDNSSSKKDIFFSSISNKVKSSFLWKKQFQMIIISIYNSLSCICTIVDHIINFNSKLPTIDITIILALSIVLILNLLFIYGCYTCDKKFLKLTPVISCFILIFVFFPKWNAFVYLLSYFRFNETKIYKFIVSIGSLSIVRVIYYVPFLILVRYLFDDYSDEFIKEITNEKEENDEEEAIEQEDEEKQDEKESEKVEKTEEKKESDNHEEVEENTSQDPETKKNN